MTRFNKEQIEQLNYAIRTLKDSQHSITVSSCIYVGVAIAVVFAIYFLIKTAYEILERGQTHCQMKLMELLKRQDEIEEKLSNIKSEQKDHVRAIVDLRGKVQGLEARIKKLEPVPIEATKALTDITNQFTGKT